MGAIHLGHEQGFAESWQRDRALHENACEGLRRLTATNAIVERVRATLCEPPVILTLEELLRAEGDSV